ncbi:MAG: hypothetical protein ABJF89_08970 [Parasphingorhabdus sp.]
MNHWPFVIASYAFVLLGTAVIVVQSYGAMRKAETKADQLRKRK